MTNLDSIWKSRDITLPTKVCLVKAMVFPVVMYGYDIWTIKKAEHRKIDAFELWCWRRLLRVPWIARRSNKSILKEISREYSLEGLMLKLKLQYFGHLIAKNWLIGKDLDAGKGWTQEKNGTTEDKLIGWHHRLKGHEFEQAPGVGEGQGSLVCCSPWGCRVGNNCATELNWSLPYKCGITSSRGKDRHSGLLVEEAEIGRLSPVHFLFFWTHNSTTLPSILCSQVGPRDWAWAKWKERKEQALGPRWNLASFSYCVLSCFVVLDCSQPFGL